MRFNRHEFKRMIKVEYGRSYDINTSLIRQFEQYDNKTVNIDFYSKKIDFNGSKIDFYASENYFYACEEVFNYCYSSESDFRPMNVSLLLKLS